MSKYCFVTPKSVLKGYIPHPSASTPLLKQCRSVIKRLNESRSLINQVPNICSFQGQAEIFSKTFGQVLLKHLNAISHQNPFQNTAGGKF